MSLRARARFVLSLAGLYAGACLLGLALLILAFQLGILARIDILFYRGLVLTVLAFMATLGLLALAMLQLGTKTVGLRDAFSAAVLSLSLNVCFLVVVPVTVDRSISLFVLGQMTAHPDETFTPDEMARLFTKVYVGDHHQIDRRLHEQTISGNVEKVGDAYRISGRGRLVIYASRLVAYLFDSHAGLLAPEDTRPNLARSAR